jgi:hypothetical protein
MAGNSVTTTRPATCSRVSPAGTPAKSSFRSRAPLRESSPFGSHRLKPAMLKPTPICSAATTGGDGAPPKLRRKAVASRAVRRQLAVWK